MIEYTKQHQIENVLFLPPVNKKLIPSLLEHMDALYIGLQRQSLFRFGISPNKMFDYMMASKPVIQAIDAGNNLVEEAQCGLYAEPDNIEEICEIADGIMVARGDLGVEIPFVEVPAIQKFLIQKCRLLGKRVITATEMLESMITNPRPTRAEISDVANAVYDGSSAIMLSGETAAGKHPVDAVRNMAEIAEYTEKHIDYRGRFNRTEFKIHNTLDSISHATCAMAIDVDAKCIVVNSVSGMTARMVSRFRCPCDIIGTTTDLKVWRQLNLSWGITPVLCEEYNSIDVMFYQNLNQAKEVLGLKPGDNVVLTGGQIHGGSGNTNTIKMETVRK